ncbi:MAG: 5'/3'-nucleotidase SurE [Planctomycetota bacterium]
MKILLTNDDGYEAPGLLALYRAVRELGTVHVVAPHQECSACSHTVTMRRTVVVERRQRGEMGQVYSVEGTPADCVRIAVSQLLEGPIDLVVSGVNYGANSGVDVFYSGTVAGAREAAFLGYPAIAVSQAVRAGVATDWPTVTDVVKEIVAPLLKERLPGPGFWNVNLPAPIPSNAKSKVHRVPIETVAVPPIYERIQRDGDHIMEFRNGASYWIRDADGHSDYGVIRNGEIAISAVPLFGRF